MTYIYISLALGVTLGYVLGLLYSKQILEEAKDALENAKLKETLVTTAIRILNELIKVQRELNVTHEETKEKED